MQADETDSPGGTPPAQSSESPIRRLIREQLSWLLAVLTGFVAASAVVIVADAPMWTKVIAAVLAFGGVALITLWLHLPWSDWRARRGRRLWIAATPLVLASLLLLLGLTAWREAPDAVPNQPATLILLDTSEGMAERLDGTDTKLSEATAELERQVRDIGNTQLGLATFGVDDCDSSDTPLDERVSIGPDNADRIRREAGSDLSPSGRANLVSAARYAVGRLRAVTHEERRVLLITGGLDGCGAALDDLLSERKHQGVSVQWELVGLRLSDEEKSQVSALPDITVHIADTPDELRDALNLTLYEGPLRDELEALREYVETDVRTPLNEAVYASNEDPPDPAATRSHLAKVEQLAKSGQDRFAEFGTEDEREEFGPVKSMLREQFGHLAEAGRRYDRVVAFDEAHTGELDDAQIEARNALIDAASEPINAYNANLAKLEDLIEGALTKLFGS